NFLHWFFSGESIAEAAYEICQERGDKARWYSPTSPKLSKWEKLMSLNGTSLKEFRNIISSQDWKVRFINKNPILSSGRRADLPVFKIVRLIFSIFTRLPYTEELFTDRVCYILEKK
ncbi:MAG: hypothetical protein H7336_08995, partial [Bacteriovorax sp.]|nr:hypothetical protein [Bacteriovorax sp.]